MLIEKKNGHWIRVLQRNNVRTHMIDDQYISQEMNLYRNPFLLCIMLHYTILPMMTSTLPREKSSVSKKRTKADEHVCDWSCNSADSELQTCEARCLLGFRHYQEGQKQCQNVCATKYLNCLEMCFNNNLLVWIYIINMDDLQHVNDEVLWIKKKHK